MKPKNNKKYSRHGLCASKEYKAYRNMLDRCYNKNNKSFKDYGARGIKVCKSWKESFIVFYNDMGATEKNMTLERVNNKGYSKDNCKWATRKEQALNRRSTRIIKAELK